MHGYRFIVRGERRTPTGRLVEIERHPDQRRWPWTLDRWEELPENLDYY
jgi:hypothetical protein